MEAVDAMVNISLSKIDALRKDSADKDLEIQKLKDEKIEIEGKIRQVKATIKVVNIEQHFQQERVKNPNYRGGYDTPFVDPYRYQMKTVLTEKSAESVEWLNFEDVSQELQLKAERDVSDKLISLQAEVNKLNEKIIKLTNEKTGEISALNTTHSNELIKMRTEHTNEMNRMADKVIALQNTVREMKNEEVEKTKDRTIQDLRKELEELKSKKAWYKF